MTLLRYLVTVIIAPLFGLLVALIAYGPWGKAAHQGLIAIFKKIYKIDYPNTKGFKTLGEFFLRDIPLKMGAAKLVSPVEGFCFEGPRPILLSERVSAKGIEYGWASFDEIDPGRFASGTFWNLYLAPHNYHWVHAPTDGHGLEAYRSNGAHLPVNAFGRWLSPRLYSVNERLTFKFQSEQFGEVILMCIGAMGVSSLYCEKGLVAEQRWSKLQEKVVKGERLLGFKLGSTVLMLTQKPISSPLPKSVLRVGDELIPGH